MNLAIFDLDDTLIDGDSASLWLAFMVERRLAPADLLRQEHQLMLDYHQGCMDMDAYMALTLAPLRHWQPADLAPLVHEFVEQEILPVVYPKARERLAWHRSQGHEVVIVSATGEHLVLPIARALGVEAAIGIQLECHESGFSGRTRGVYSFREGKLTRLRHWLTERQLTPTLSYGYSDSMNDLPLLEYVDRAAVINGSETLSRLATERGWEQLRWHR
ncbi:HAD family hydrolase [Oceanisphaera psychrotolerans]|uniref:Hydrolase n=1 Tax=Oceanisphaera psychrotolerans TaxID=1414654 RepID=A0A1J4QCP6_9GAMM|nr:HAD family hydrolase [Oceanisphaera psychrotolerans]OIN06601.1 hydrolase [Oceanisphaera psychrotolerans]